MRTSCVLARLLLLSMWRSGRVLFAAFAILVAVDGGVAADMTGADITAFVRVTVVPMDRERLLKNWTVVVADGRIRDLGPSSAIKTPKGATLIDGRDKYLMPGLADMHAHIWEEAELPLFLANGVTTIRNMFGGPIHLRWKERIAAGDLVSPTIYTAGPIIDGNPPVWPGAVVENRTQARETVTRQYAAGYDFLKAYSRLSREAYDAVIQEGAAQGLSVSGHVPDSVGLAAALRSGIKSIEHLSGYEVLAKKQIGPGEEAIWARLDESQFAAVARETAKSGTWNCPTLVLYQHRIAPGEPEFLRTLIERPEMRYVSPETVRQWYPENNYLKSSSPARAASSRGKGDIMRKKLVKALHDAGARLLLGTDCGNPFVVPGFSVHLELRNFVDAGLSPFEAIRAGTSGAAEFMNAGAEFGTVAKGSRADLILVEGNPLEDVSNVDKRAGVMIRGKWYSQAELQNQLEKLASQFRPDSQ
jgi:imidazolonepropionase-like amidohydrolase